MQATIAKAQIHETISNKKVNMMNNIKIFFRRSGISENFEKFLKNFEKIQNIKIPATSIKSSFTLKVRGDLFCSILAL